MSKSLKLAAIAAALVVGSTSVYATGGGLTAAQVRNIVKQEIAKIPQAPAGMDGFPSMFAHVLPDGSVYGEGDPTGGGITHDNIRVVRTDTGVKYCFIGLPPTFGGQVTLDDSFGLAVKLVVPHLVSLSSDLDCPTEVRLMNARGKSVSGGFQIILY